MEIDLNYIKKIDVDGEISDLGYIEFKDGSENLYFELIDKQTFKVMLKLRM